MENLGENVTLNGYSSKKQGYIYPVVSGLIFITAILFFFFAEENKKYASIPLALIAVGFLYGFIDLQRQPSIALKIFDDRYAAFYTSHSEKHIDLYSVKEVYYWPSSTGLKITFVTENGKEHFSYLLENADDVKGVLIAILEGAEVKIKRKYTE